MSVSQIVVDLYRFQQIIKANTNESCFEALSPDLMQAMRLLKDDQLNAAVSVMAMPNPQPVLIDICGYWRQQHWPPDFAPVTGVKK